MDFHFSKNLEKSDTMSDYLQYARLQTQLHLHMLQLDYDYDYQFRAFHIENYSNVMPWKLSVVIFNSDK